jgi:4Fe-4S ferredoxin
MPKRDRIQPYQAYQFLPRTNCKLCGFPGCFAFAVALISREKGLKDCPELEKDAYRHLLERLKEYFGEEVAEVEKTGLLVSKDRCNGCGDCVVVCNKALTAIGFHEGIIVHRQEREVTPVLEIADGIVRVINWDSCRRCAEPPTLCRVCEEKCPFGALELVKRGEKAFQ